MTPLPSEVPAAGLRVARLTPADAPAYRRLMLHAYEHAADAFTSTVEERAAETEAWWAHRIAHPDGLGVGFGAFDGGELVGCLALEFNLKPKTRHRALVIGMYVMPPWRGRGAARALLHAVIGHAQSREGTQVLGLTVTDGNDEAIGLYRSFGFEAFGTEPLALLTPAGFRSKVYMTRRVGAAE